MTAPAPILSGTVRGLCHILNEQGVDAQPLVDTSLAIGVIICKDNQAIRQLLWPTIRTRLPSASPNQNQSSSGSQEFLCDIDEDDLATLDAALPATGGISSPLLEQQPVDLTSLVYKTSDKNKRHLKKLARQKKVERLVEIRTRRVNRSRPGRLSISATVVSSGEDDTVEEGTGKGMSDIEKEKGGESDESNETEEMNMLEKEQDLAKAPVSVSFAKSWFAKIDIGGILSPALTFKILDAAVAIGNPEAVEDLYTLIHDWPTKPVSTLTFPGLATDPAHLRTAPAAITTLYHVYHQVQLSETDDNLRAITHRMRLVGLSRAYTCAESVYADTPLPPAQHGQTRKAQRKRQLFDMLYPNMLGVDIQADPHAAKLWLAFTHRLGFGSRWCRIQEELGYGVLGLIPHRKVSNTWLQKELSDPHFTIWIEAVKQFNPDCIKAGETWSQRLAQALHVRPRIDVPEDLPITSSQAHRLTLTQ